ncbi:hypothetical protein B0H14DRAFT_2586762 [Mycena olivaceomarginata]|nr:hypothetical protein B0H14DRAFT_2586762 [Mycena olivaceomarginata]
MNKSKMGAPSDLACGPDYGPGWDQNIHNLNVHLVHAGTLGLHPPPLRNSILLGSVLSDTSDSFPWLWQSFAKVVPWFIHGCILSGCFPAIPSGTTQHIAIPPDFLTTPEIRFGFVLSDASVPFPWLWQSSAWVVPRFIHGCILCCCLPSISSGTPQHIAVPLGPLFYFSSETFGSLCPTFSPTPRTYRPPSGPFLDYS